MSHPLTEAASNLTPEDLEHLCALMRARMDVDDVLRQMTMEQLREVLAYVRALRAGVRI